MEPITSDTEARPAELQIRLKRRTFLKGLLGATAALLGGNFLAACGNTVREDATVTSPMASPTAAPSPAPTSTPTPPPTATPRPTPYPNGAAPGLYQRPLQTGPAHRRPQWRFSLRA
ncbi:MAG TPA: hypothetical protein PLD43_07895, partial [Anaerolineae bacterium]|nr:hypothetical protein [Anaerolineae bacterium]